MISTMIPKTVILSVVFMMGSGNYSYCKANKVKTAFEKELTPEMKLNMVRTENGCPFPFDFGQLGNAWYAPHDICYNRRFPPYLDPDAKHPQSNGEIEFEFGLFPGMSDTYKCE